jgi:hypothetical protein
MDVALPSLFPSWPNRVCREVQTVASLAQGTLSEGLLTVSGFAVHLVDQFRDPSLAVDDHVHQVSSADRSDPHASVTIAKAAASSLPSRAWSCRFRSRRSLSLMLSMRMTLFVTVTVQASSKTLVRSNRFIGIPANSD